MYKKWVFYVRSACALSCIFCMLFLNTLSVRAATNFYNILDSNLVIDETAIPITLTFDIAPSNMYSDTSGGTYSGSSAPTNPIVGNMYGGFVNGGPNTVDPSIILSPNLNRLSNLTETGTISFSSTHGGLCIAHVEIPYNFDLPFVNNGDIDPNAYYAWFPGYANMQYNTSQIRSIRNFSILDENKELITSRNSGSNRPAQYKLGSEFLGINSSYAVFNGYITFDLSIDNITVVQTANVTFDFYPRLRKVKTEYQGSVGSINSDPVQHELQEESNEIAEDTNETTHSIFDSISDFFGSFFTNLIGVFVPEDGYFTNWFTRVNNLLAAKLGILYYPFNYLISFLTEISTYLDADSEYRSHCYITFPAIQFRNVATNETYTFLQEQTVDLGAYPLDISGNSYVNSVSDRFTTVAQSIRIFNNCIIIFALFHLSYRKLKLILEGHEDDN